MTRRLWPLALTAVLVLTACTSTTSVEGPSPAVASPLPATATATATVPASPTPIPTDTPTPRPTPQATVTPFLITDGLIGTVLTASADVQQAIAGPDILFSVGGFQPLEDLTVVFLNPRGFRVEVLSTRADLQGHAAWRRNSRFDAPGVWSSVANGAGGSTQVIRYQLTDLVLPSGPESPWEFELYSIPEADLHYDASLRPAIVALVAQFYRGSVGPIAQTLDFDFSEPLDVFLLPDSESLQREVQAGGADPGSGFEAGVSLFGFERSGIYIDTTGPVEGFAHVIAHELVHQITGRIEANRRAPLWFIEGMADYFGYTIARTIVGDEALPWRRYTRGVARDAVDNGGWIDLNTISAYEVWQSERDPSRLERMYAQSYATVDWLAQTYGEAVLRPLLEALADEPDDLDAVFQRIVSLDLAEVQQQAQAYAIDPDPYEREVAAIIGYARLMFQTLDEAQAVSEDWNRYVARRSTLPRGARISSLDAFRTTYAALDRQIDEAVAPERMSMVHEIFVQIFPFYLEAVDAFLLLEQGADDALENGNAAVQQGNFFLQAAQDHLIARVNDLAISQAEVFR